MSMPTVSQLAQMGVGDLFEPPAQEILPGVTSHLSVPFAVVPGYRVLRLDLHLPHDRSGPLPLVVYVSGGAWRMVMKHHGPWPPMLEEGYAVAVLEHRLSGEAVLPAALHDVKAAVRFLRGSADRFGLATERVAGWGSSAGGYLISMCALTNGVPEYEGTVGEHLNESSTIDAVIDHYGATDLAAMAEDTNDIPGVVEHFGTETSVETQFLGFQPDTRPDLAAALSAVAHARNDVPFLIMHGDGDTRLGINQSRRLYEALHEAGAEVEFRVIPGADHAGPEFFSDDAHKLARDFLQRFLLRGPGS